jgi:hypothetical protein
MMEIGGGTSLVELRSLGASVTMTGGRSMALEGVSLGDEAFDVEEGVTFGEEVSFFLSWSLLGSLSMALSASSSPFSSSSSSLAGSSMSTSASTSMETSRDSASGPLLSGDFADTSALDSLGPISRALISKSSPLNSFKDLTNAPLISVR